MKQVKHSKNAIFLLIAVCIVVSSLSCVSATDVYVSTNGSDSNAGSVDSPYLTIGTGVTSSAANDTVHIADGVYSGTGNTNIQINKNLTISGQSQSGTIIDGNNANRIFIISSGTNVVLQNLTITNANTINDGGAIYNEGTLTATNCSFTNNNATFGGAIVIYGNAILTGCTFTSNTVASGWGGAAIFNDRGTLTATNCNFTNNNATSDSGGALYNAGNAILTGCTFTSNSASWDGGAIWNERILSVNFSRIIGNNALSNGNAIYNYNGTVNVTYNWWGTNTPDFANLIFVENGSVNATSWLVLSINAIPSEIFNTQTSNVTVDLYTDSNGANHSSESAKYPAFIPVTLTTTWGSIIPTAITLNHGAGAALFTADGGAIPTTPFVATVTAADSANKTATVPANITILNNAPIGNNTSITTTGKIPSVNAASTVAMQNTGVPLNYLILAILAVISGFVVPKRK